MVRMRSVKQQARNEAFQAVAKSEFLFIGRCAMQERRDCIDSVINLEYLPPIPMPRGRALRGPYV